MTCPFGYGSSLQQTQALEQKMKDREAAGGAATVPAASEASSSSASPGEILPPLHSGARPRLPLALFTGGVRTSLGVENAHPISVWMKEMQSRGGLKGIDIEKELLGFEGAVGGALDAPVQPQTSLQALDEIAAAQAAKNWKEKRERPPAVLDASTIPLASPPNNASSDGSQGPTHPAHVHLYPGMFSGRINHNASKHIPMAAKYNQEITYWNYIHPEALTCLQNGRQGKGLNNPDEHLFILVHQVFELWFKQILWELEFVRNYLISYEDPWLPKHDTDSNPILRCVQRLHRSDKIMRLATEGYGIMETMNPGDFLMFRDFLSPSSGFQSVQLRELEILLGLKDEERIPCAGRHYREAFMANGENKTSHFDNRLSEFSLKDSLYVYLRRHVPTANLDQFLSAYFEVINTQNDEKSKDFEEELSLLEKMMARTGDAREQAYLKDLTEKAKFGRTLARNSSEDVKLFFKDPLLGVQRTSILFLFTYHTHPKLAATSELVSSMLAIEQAVLLWRHRHARMVESFIGRRPGTGGSSGVEYIDATATQYRIFTDIWRIRSLCVARSKINFDPDNGAVWTEGGSSERMSSNLKEVEEGIRAETQAIKDRAAGIATKDPSVMPAVTAQALHVHHPGATAPSHAEANGALANSTNSIAAGVGAGAAVGQNA